MNIAISNLAWPPADDDAVFALLKERGLSRVEIAPTKYFPEIEAATPDQIRAVKARFAAAKLTVVGFQSLLFGQPDLKVFAEREVTDRTIDYLGVLAKLCSDLGGQVMVFGSPKNRQVPAEMTKDDAWRAAVDFFWKAGQRCHEHGVTLVIEPNPVQYHCNFITNVEQAARLVREVDSPGFGLHLDLGAITLNGEDVKQVIADSADILNHFHISEPEIKPLQPDNPNHKLAAAALRRAKYQGVVSIEMLPPPNGLEQIGEALDFAVATYG